MSDPIIQEHDSPEATRVASPFLAKRHPPTMAASLVGVISLVIITFIGWGACTLERRLVTATGHSLVQAATDSANKLELMIADSTLREEGTINLKAIGLPSANLTEISERGFIEEQHLRRDAPVITAYAHVTVRQAQPPLRWGILIRVDRDSILTRVRTFLQTLMIITVLIIVPLCLLLIWLVKRVHYEWGLAEHESLRASKAEAALSSRAEALHAVVIAANDFAAATELDGLIQHMLHHAKTITGSRYAILGMLDDRVRTFTRVHAIGCEERIGQAISRVPLSGGLLHCLTARNGVLRIADLAREIGEVDIEGIPHSLGSFLGLSLRCHGRICAQLYLMDKVSEKGNRTAFTDLDEHVLLALAAQFGVSVENLQLLLEAKAQAQQDSLTGLLNHSASLEALSRELSRAAREHEPLAIIMADIDHFKRVNDTYGHVIGDCVIRETARRIQETARRYDLVGRIGGEEFLVILPGCGEVAAAEIAERIRYAIAGDSFDTQTGPLSITLSLGVATCSKENPAFSQLLWQLADQALYRVKKNGRNGIEFAAPPRHIHYDPAA